MALAGQRIRSWFQLGKPLLKVKLILSGLQRVLRVQSNPFSFLSAEPEEERCQHRVWVKNSGQDHASAPVSSRDRVRKQRNGSENCHLIASENAASLPLVQSAQRVFVPSGMQSLGIQS
jgi:hypothetical protein